VCGLALIASVDGSPLPPPRRAVLDRMVRTVAHRGPDEQEYFHEPQAALGFTRLSLVDPESGGQPLHAPDGSAVLIANGEIYNHRELAAALASRAPMRTRSDCEVLAHLYAERGRDFVRDIRGMFAIIVVDVRRRKVVLARDRFGIKPLYYHRTPDRVAAASEIKALFCDPDTPRSVDWPATLGSSLFAAVPAVSDQRPTTWFSDIEQVEAGTVVEIDLRDGRCSTHRYWTLPTDDVGADRDGAAYIEEYGRLLAESVRDCATADAEIGLFLSGGVDSAAVAALARDVAPMQTFTAVNPGTLANGDAQFAHQLADRLGLPNHQVIFDPRRMPSAGEWKDLVWQVETPMCGPEVFYKYELHRYARSVAPDLKGMLLGAASDEFNGGYSRDLSDDTGWSGFLEAVQSMRDRGAQLRRPELRPWVEQFGGSLLTDAALGLPEDAYRSYLESEHRKIAQYNVWHEDRTAAASGIEARVPFLDHRLVELVASVPPPLRPQLLWDKEILRSAMRTVLPPGFRQRPKVAFFYGSGTADVYAGFAAMLLQDGAALVHEALDQPAAKDLLRTDAVLAALRRAATSGSGELELVLRLVNIGLLDSMTADLPAPLVDRLRPALPPRHQAPDWDQAARELPALLGLVSEPDPDRPLELGDGVLLAESREDPGTLLVLVDGELEYVVDDPGQGRLLRAVDGRTPLRALLADAGVRLAEVREMLDESVRAGLLQPADPAAGALPAAAAAGAGPE
jgi:asparagine synthase (glutamine-hydrolysing)